MGYFLVVVVDRVYKYRLLHIPTGKLKVPKTLPTLPKRCESKGEPSQKPSNNYPETLQIKKVGKK